MLDDAGMVFNTSTEDLLGLLELDTKDRVSWQVHGTSAIVALGLGQERGKAQAAMC